MTRGDPFRKVLPGQSVRLPAAAWNAFIDAALAYKRAAQDLLARTRRSAARTGIVQIKNDSGAARGRFEVLGIDDVVPDPDQNADAFSNGPALVGSTPTLADHRGRFAVLLAPAADGAFAPAVVSGITVAKVSVDDADHLFADVADGDASYLASGVTGAAAILWAESGTGTKYAVVRIGVDAMAGQVCFPVLVWRDGGTTDGDESNPCNRTYTAKTLDSAVTLGTGLTPKRRRPAAGKLSVPSDTGDGEVGLGYHDQTGAFVLYDANETLAVEACS